TRLVELGRVLGLLLRRRRVRRVGDGRRGRRDLRLDHRLLAALGRDGILVGARALRLASASAAAAATAAPGPAPARARTPAGATRAAAGAAPALAHRAETLAVGLPATAGL